MQVAAVHRAQRLEVAEDQARALMNADFAQVRSEANLAHLQLREGLEQAVFAHWARGKSKLTEIAEQWEDMTLDAIQGSSVSQRECVGQIHA